MAGGDQVIDDEAGQALERDWQLGRRRDTAQPGDQVGKACDKSHRGHDRALLSAPYQPAHKP